MNPRDPLSDPKFEAQVTKPPAINRLDPAWSMFAAAYLRIMDMKTINSDAEMIEIPADFADAMLRERDRRDREERP